MGDMWIRGAPLTDGHLVKPKINVANTKRQGRVLELVKRKVSEEQHRGTPQGFDGLALNIDGLLTVNNAPSSPSMTLLSSSSNMKKTSSSNMKSTSQRQM